MAGTTIKIKQSAIAGKVPAAGLLVQGELALNTTDQKLYSKDATGYIFEIGGGSGGGGNEIITHEFTATAGQTTFAALYSTLNDHINVYYNGMKLIAADYVVTSGTEVVLTDPALVDDIVTVEVIKALNLANGSDIAEHEFIATAGQTIFAVPDGGYNKISDNIEVFVNGIKLVNSLDFIRIDGINVVLTDPADIGDEVTIKLIKVVALAGVVNSSGASAILPSGTTADRDASPSAGYLRWNTTLNSTEVYNGTTWEDDNDHTHTISDTTGLQTALDSKLNLTGGTLTGSLGATGLNVVIPHTATNSYAYISSDENNSGVDPEILRLEELNDSSGNPNWLSLNAHGLSTKGTLHLGRTGRQTKIRGKTFLFETTGTWNGSTGSIVNALTFTEMGAATFDNSITSGSITTTGNISVTGTVDGRDIAADGLVLDLAASVSYVDTSIADLVDSAPATLNTLNELALALGDDANHVTTMTNLIGTKLSLAGGTLTGNVKYNDNVKAQFGTGNDLQIFSDGDNTHIFASNTVGDLYITGSDLILRASATSSKYFRGFASTGEVKLYHSDNPKLATTSTGINVTGNLGISGTVDGRDLVTDGTKLDGIADSANNYTHPANHAISVITGLQSALDGKVANSRVLTDVPAGAVFTDTTYSHPATHTIAEVSGLQAELDNIRAEAVAMAIALG